MIDGSEKRNRQLAFANFRIRMFVKSAVRKVLNSLMTGCVFYFASTLTTYVRVPFARRSLSLLKLACSKLSDSGEKPESKRHAKS